MGALEECLVLFDRSGGLPHLALQLPVPPSRLPAEAGETAGASSAGIPRGGRGGRGGAVSGCAMAWPIF